MLSMKIVLRWVCAVCGIFSLVNAWTFPLYGSGVPEISHATAYSGRMLKSSRLAPCSVSGVTWAPCDPSETVYTGQTITTHFTVTAALLVSYSAPLVITCTGVVVSCSATPTTLTVSWSNPAAFDVSYVIGNTPGSGTVVVKTGKSLTSTVSVSAIQSDFVIDTAKTLKIDQQLSLCSSNCFAGSTSFSTVPFFTKDTPRRLTLVYQEDRAHPHPIITADVSLIGSSTSPSQYQLSATLNSAPVTFVNGDTKSYFGGSSATVRLAQEFDASSISTGVDTLAVTVGAMFGGTTIQHTYKQLIAIVNESSSPVAAGWTIAGWQRLYPAAGGYLITDGTGDAVFFSSLGTRAADYTTLRYDSGSSQYIRTALDSTRAFFSSAGILTQVVDRLGDTTRYFATGARLDSIFDPQRVATGMGTYLSLNYGPGGNSLTAIAEVGGAARVTTVTVDTDQTIASIIDPDNVNTKYRYDLNKRLSTIIDRRGDTTSFFYNSVTWKLSELDLPRIPIDAGGGGTTMQRPAIAYTPWMTRAVPTTATSPSILMTPIAPGVVVGTIVDPIGRATTISVDRWGEPLTIEDPATRTTTIVRNGQLPTLIVGPLGNTDSISYVSGLPLVSRIHTMGDSAVNYHYGAASQVDSIWGPGQSTEIRILNNAGQITNVLYGGVTATETFFSYDAFNRIIQVVDPGGHTTRYHYDAIFGNKDSVVGPRGITLVHRFDQVGRDTADWGSGASSWFRIRYDLINRRIAAWHDGVSWDSTTVDYDGLYSTRVVTQGGQVHKIVTNALGWPTATSDVGDTTKFITMRYDAAGRVTSTTNRRSQRIDRVYDVLDRILSQSGTGGLPTDTYSYLNNGRVLTAWRPNVSRDSIYFSISGKPDSLIRKIAGHRYAVLYAGRDKSDSAGSRSAPQLTSDVGIAFVQQAHRFNYPVNGGYAFVYDSLTGGGGDRVPQQLINGDGLQQSLVWRGAYLAIAGQPQPSSPAAAVLHRYTALHQHVSDSAYVTLTGSSLSDSLTRGYTYDSVGHEVFEYRKSAPGSLRTQYVYDGLGRLMAVYQTNGSTCTATLDSLVGNKYIGCSATTLIDSVSYDSAGNPRKVSDVYAAGNRLISWPTNTGAFTYTYDGDGNLSTRTHGGVTDTLFWSATNQLDSVYSGGRHVVYEYNSYGQLVRRTVNGTIDRFFFWDDTHLLAELNSTGGRRAQYLYDQNDIDRPLAVATDSGATSKVRYLFLDMQGNVVGVVRDTFLLRYTSYTPRGQFASSTSSVLEDTLRLAWKGLMYEGDSTKLYYVRNRWYDPTTGRFVSEDPVGIRGGTNLYAFGNYDPINGHDPFGQCLYGSLSQPDNFHQKLHNALKGFTLPYKGRGIMCTGDDSLAAWVYVGAYTLDPVSADGSSLDTDDWLDEGSIPTEIRILGGGDFAQDEVVQHSYVNVPDAYGGSCTLGFRTKAYTWGDDGRGEASTSWTLPPGIGCSGDFYLLRDGEVQPADFSVNLGLGRHFGLTFHFDIHGLQAVGFHGGLAATFPDFPVGVSF